MVFCPVQSSVGEKKFHKYKDSYSLHEQDIENLVWSEAFNVYWAVLSTKEKRNKTKDKEAEEEKNEEIRR